MNAPVATAAQLLPTVERALRKGGRRSRVVLVRASPDGDRLPDLRLGADVATVRASRSPLEIRALINGHDGARPLVVLTDCDRHQLGDDLLARVAGRDVFPLDRWQSVRELFGARDISADLSRKRHLADALIEARPVDGYPPVRGKVLDTDTAVAALQQAYLGISADVTTLAELVGWAARPDAAGQLRRAGPEVLADIRRFLGERFGPGVDVLLAIVAGRRGGDLVAWGLVGALVHDPRAEAGPVIATRLEYELDRTAFPAGEWRGLGAAAAAHLRDVDAVDPAQAHGWRARAEAILAGLRAKELAEWSDELPSGFALRLASAGAALTAWDDDPSDARLAEAAAAAVERAAAHRLANVERVTRLRMAARLIRRAPAPLAWGDRLADAARTYQRDGAWVDWARTVVSRGESEPTLAGLYRRLSDRFDAARDDDNRRFASIGATAAQPVEAPLLGVEQVLDAVVGPLAGERPVLVVVLDGLSWPTWVEISGALGGYGWTPYRRRAGGFDPVGVAVLPTLTEVSRTSLLCGRVRRGDGDSEKRGFAAHPALRHGGAEPVLWHKAQLRAGGLDTNPDELLQLIGDPAQRVVGVVINNIDERLKDVAQPPEGWGLPELDPLSWCLDAARRAGRPVIITADHGHLLERDGEQVTGGSGGGGERWRVADREPADGEIVVHGPRVCVGDRDEPMGRAILPWRERIRYTSRHNGYHGGITPQELFVPVAVLAADDAVLAGWEAVAVAPPAWWHHVPVAPPAVTVPSGTVAPARKVRVPEEPTLFDLDVAPAVPAAVTTLGGGWAGEVAAALAPYKSSRFRLSDEQVIGLLSVLAAHDAQTITEDRLADLAGLPAARIGRFLSQLQDLVNIDGYGVLSIVGREIRFDKALLDRQLGRT